MMPRMVMMMNSWSTDYGVRTNKYVSNFYKYVGIFILGTTLYTWIPATLPKSAWKINVMMFHLYWRKANASFGFLCHSWWLFTPTTSTQYLQIKKLKRFKKLLISLSCMYINYSKSKSMSLYYLVIVCPYIIVWNAKGMYVHFLRGALLLSRVQGKWCSSYREAEKHGKALTFFDENWYSVSAK